MIEKILTHGYSSGWCRLHRDLAVAFIFPCVQQPPPPPTSSPLRLHWCGWVRWSVDAGLLYEVNHDNQAVLVTVLEICNGDPLACDSGSLCELEALWPCRPVQTRHEQQALLPKSVPQTEVSKMDTWCWFQKQVTPQRPASYLQPWTKMVLVSLANIPIHNYCKMFYTTLQIENIKPPKAMD